VTHGENLRVLIFEESACEAASLACLAGESGRPLQTGLASGAGKPGIAPIAAIPDIRVCGTRETSSGFEGETA